MPKIARTVRPDLESDILARIRKVLAVMPDVRIFRNNVGSLKDATGRRVTYGLGVGSADLIGSLTCLFVAAGNYPGRVVPPRIARALAIEVKRPGEKLRPEQARWADMARAAGWIVGVCTSADEAVELLARARRWEV